MWSSNHVGEVPGLCFFIVDHDSCIVDHVTCSRGPRRFMHHARPHRGEPVGLRLALRTHARLRTWPCTRVHLAARPCMLGDKLGACWLAGCARLLATHAYSLCLAYGPCLACRLYRSRLLFLGPVRWLLPELYLDPILGFFSCLFNVLNLNSLLLVTLHQVTLLSSCNKFFITLFIVAESMVSSCNSFSWIS